MTSKEVQVPQTPESDFDELHLPHVDNHFDEMTEEEEEEEDTVDEINGDKFPFNSTHHEDSSFKDISREVLVPGINIHVKIIEAVKTQHNILSPYLYTIKLKHGSHRWIIRRRYRHFQHLHNQLQMFYRTLHLPIPMKRLRKRRHTLHCRNINRNIKPPRFPRKSDALIDVEHLPARSKQLEEYLQRILLIPLYCYHPETLTFLEVSEYSFVDELGQKRKEGLIRKRAGGQRTVSGLFYCCLMCRNWCTHFASRWLIIKDTFLAYVHPKTCQVHFVMLMDRGFEVQIGMYQTGIKRGILISNLTRKLLIKCNSRRNASEWYEEIVNTANHTGKDFIEPNRFNSFAPIRNDSLVHWYVDGVDYYEDVADALEAAKEEIFITDWWLTPEIFLKRPSIDGQKWRLDKVLQRKAEAGVKVFVLLYKEVEFALGLNSLYSKQQLVEKNPENIRVLRHPDKLQASFLWAHHEKMVVIDQRHAFIGGFDLCYGRWDTPEHKLTDLGGIIRPKHSKQITNDHAKTSSTPNIAGFGAYNIFQLAHATQNISLAHVRNVSSKQDKTTLSKRLHALTLKSSVLQTSSSPLVPSCDNASTPDINNDTSDDNSRSNEIDGEDVRKTISRLTPWKHKRNRSLDNEDILSAKPKANFQYLETSEEVHRASSVPALDKIGNTKLWIGKDYANFIVRDIVDMELPFIDLIDRTTIPRMPWHDIGVYVQGKVARDVSRHFIQRWNFTKEEKAKDHPAYPWLLPKSYSDLDSIEPIFQRVLGKVSCQMLRSVTTWSAGITTTEDSIHRAYIHAIETSNHFIYIENQFFISQAAGHRDVSNKIADALYHRIVRAHKEEKAFRVYVVLPLLPAFEGEFGTNKGAAIQAITHWNYISMCRGEQSLIGRLSKMVPDPMEYLSFYGLRNHSMLNDIPVTELIYVHSKLLIVDDRVAIIGSANLNDRSMLGKRDSEIAVYLEDTEMKPSTIANVETSVGKVISKLRCNIFKEFLGILKLNPDNIDVSDPVSESFYKEVWIKTAALNTSIFEKVFNCLPTDAVQDFIQLKKYQMKISTAISNPGVANDMLARIQGFLVLFPLQFLCCEVLTPATKEALLPTSTWV